MLSNLIIDGIEFITTSGIRIARKEKQTMKINQNVKIVGTDVVLVPYRTLHVLK